MEYLDAAATLWINHFAGRSVVSDQLAVGASTVGVPLMILAVVALWWRRKDRTHTRHVAIVSGLAFCLGLLLNQAILLFVHRLRPYDTGLTHLLIAPTTDFSFPSDHATASFSIAFAFLIGGLRKYGSLFAGIALAIALSRIYVGTHYVSDVIGGALTALVAAIAVARLYPAGNPIDRRLTQIL